MKEKVYAIDIMGESLPTYVLQPDVVKLVKSINMGVKLVLVGQTFINPSSIKRIRRAYNVDENSVDIPDPELLTLLDDKKRLT